jgi:hypothetical protein
MKQFFKNLTPAAFYFFASFAFLCFFSVISEASICRVSVNDVNYTPPQKPSLSVGSTFAMRIFGANTNLCTSVSSSGSGITILKTSVNKAVSACTTEVRVNVTVTSAAALGERTFTVFYSNPALPGTNLVAGTFKVDITSAFCNTPTGQLSLMLAPVSINPVVSPSADNKTYTLAFTSNLFKIAQPEATNLSCQNSATLFFYHAASSAELSNLDQLAANDNAEVFVASAGVNSKDVTFTRSGNTLSCSVSLPRSLLPAGTRFYRIGKRISKEGAFDPYVFSPVFSFNVVNNPPVANAGSDKSVTSSSITLSAAGSSDDAGIRDYFWSKVVGPGTPVFSNSTAISTSVSGLLTGTYTFRVRVEDSNGASAFDEVNVVVGLAPAPVAVAQPDLVVEGISQRFFGGGNGTVGDGTFTYYMLPQTFCTGLPPLTSFTQVGTLPNTFASTADKRIMKLDYNLPDMRIYIKNQGAAGTGAGFHVELFKTTSSSVALKSFTSPLLAAGASSFVTYSGRGVAPVYRFPGFDTDDPRFCYVRQEIDHSFPPSYELESNQMQIKIDSRTVITESNENNNTLFVGSSTNPIIR